MLQELIGYGLSEREARVYLVCLKLGQATANQIALQSELARSTTYDILYRLKTLGFVTTYIIDSKNYFIANDPEILLTSLSEKDQSIKSVLPELNKIYGKVEDKPSTIVLQGKSALYRLFDQVYDTASQVFLILNMNNAKDVLGYHTAKIRKRRTEKKVRMKQLMEASKQAETILDDVYTENRYLKKIGKSNEATLIFDNTVLHILLLKHEVSIIKITSKDHAHAMKIMFNELWDKATPNP